MSRMHAHHNPGCGVEGKCSVPMFSGYGPAGFCDSTAWGQQYSEREPQRGQSGRYADPCWPLRDRNGYYPTHLAHLRPSFASGFCCEAHGGPGPNAIRFVMDGNMWCAFRADFINLAESKAGFGRTQDVAEADLISREQEPA